MTIEPTTATTAPSTAVGSPAGPGPALAVGPPPPLAVVAPATAHATPPAPLLPDAALPAAAAPGVESDAWARIAAEAAAARDEVAVALSAGLDAPGLLDGLARAASTLGSVQQRIAAGSTSGDRGALASVVAAHSSVEDARRLVGAALESYRPVADTVHH